MRTFDEAIQGAAMILAQACDEIDALSPREAATQAWFPGHRLGSIDAIEELIIRQRSEAERPPATGAHSDRLNRQQAPLAA